MASTQFFSTARRDQVLEQVIVRNVRAVLSHRSSAGWRTYKAMLSSGSRASNQLCVRVSDASAAATELLPAAGDSVGVTFRLNHRKCVFGAVVDSVRSGPEHIEFSLRWPDHLHQLQRRSFERVDVPLGCVIAVRLWRDQPSHQGQDVRHGQLENLSAGGMGVSLARSADLTTGESYRCMFTPRPGAPSLLLEARVQHRDPLASGRESIGLQFLGLESTAAGRRVLVRLAELVDEFQRANVLASRHGS